MSQKTQPCPECGGVMRYEKHDDVLTYKDHTKTLKTLGWWCSRCGEGILASDALVAHEKAFLAFKAEVDGVFSPAQVAAVRKSLGLSQRKASELLGGGPRAFQKYEIGSQAVSAPMTNLLVLLANDPSRLDEIRVTKVVTKVRAPRTRTRKVAASRKTAVKKVARKNAGRKSEATRSPARKKRASG